MYTILYYWLMFNNKKADALVNQAKIIGSILLVVALNGLLIISQKHHLSNSATCKIYLKKKLTTSMQETSFSFCFDASFFYFTGITFIFSCIL